MGGQGSGPLTEPTPLARNNRRREVLSLAPSSTRRVQYFGTSLIFDARGLIVLRAASRRSRRRRRGSVGITSFLSL